MLVVADSGEQLYKMLERARIRAMQWGEKNHVVFNNSTDEMLAFTRHRKPYLKRRLAKDRITVRGYMLGFNTKMTHWLRVYLDTGLQFRAHKNLSLEKV